MYPASQQPSAQRTANAYPYGYGAQQQQQPQPVYTPAQGGSNTAVAPVNAPYGEPSGIFVPVNDVFNPTLSETDLSLLSTFRQLAGLQAIAGFIGAISSWSPYFIPVIMGVFAIIGGWILYDRCTNPYNFLQQQSCWCSCCGNGRSQLTANRAYQIFICVLGVGGVICAILAAAIGSPSAIYIGVSIVCIVCCVIVTITSFRFAWRFSHMTRIFDDLAAQQAVFNAAAAERQTTMMAGAGVIPGNTVVVQPMTYAGGQQQQQQPAAYNYGGPAPYNPAYQQPMQQPNAQYQPQPSPYQQQPNPYQQQQQPNAASAPPPNYSYGHANYVEPPPPQGQQPAQPPRPL